MCQTSTCNHLFHFCGKQVSHAGDQFCPCDGCLSKFSCRGYWSMPTKKPAAVEIALPILLTLDGELHSRLDPSHETVEVHESSFCTTV